MSVIHILILIKIYLATMIKLIHLYRTKDLDVFVWSVMAFLLLLFSFAMDVVFKGYVGIWIMATACGYAFLVAGKIHGPPDAHAQAAPTPEITETPEPSEWVALKSYVDMSQVDEMKRDKAMLTANHIASHVKSAGITTLSVKSADFGAAAALMGIEPIAEEPAASV